MGMLERDQTYNDVLDRIERVEARVEDLRDVARPTEVIIYENPEWQALAGWISTGDVLRSLDGEIVLDPTIPMIRVGTGGYVQSEDFITGVSGFQINGGVAEFNDVVIRGTIYAELGEIGGWEIGTYTLTADSGAVGLNSEATGGVDWRIWAGHATPSSAPFRVDESGNLVATNATITGTITATTGTIGGWTIGAAALTGGNATLHSTGYLLLGTGNDIVDISAVDANYRLWIGNAAAASAPFRVTKAGAVTAISGAIGGWTLGTYTLMADAGAVGLNSEATGGVDWRLWAGHVTPGSAPFRVDENGNLYATSASVTGFIDANSGHLGSLDVDGVITVGAGAPYIQIDGGNKRIQSSSYASGISGMRIQANGDAEFNNVRVRGALTSAVFVRDLIEARAGSMLIVKSGGALAVDMVVPGSGTWTATVQDPPGGGFLFANGDICRCKTEYSAGIGDIWFVVSARADNGDGTQNYTCTYSSGTRSITYPAGAPVLDYGVSGDGGLFLTADATNGPFLDVFTHAGAPWTTLTEHLRLGNLNGLADYAADAYGIFIGDYAGDRWMSYDPTNSLRIRGDAIIDGTIQATAFTNDLGALFFSQADGLLLLGPGCEISPTAWVSTRGQAATISGAFHQVAGRWAESRALMVEVAATNIIKNSSFETNTTGWASAWSDTIARSTEQARYGDASLKITGNGAAGTGAWTAETVVASTVYTASMWFYVPGDWDGSNPHIRVYENTWGTLLATSAVVTERDRWIYRSILFTPSLTTVRIVGYDIGSATTSVYIDGVDVTLGAFASTHIDGSLGIGYAWTGAAHASTSTRALTQITLDPYTSLVSGNDTLSFSAWVQAPYDSDDLGGWQSSVARVFTAYYDASNNISLLYNATTTGYFYMIVNGTNIAAGSSALSFAAGDWLHVTATLDFTNDEYKIYVQSELEIFGTNVLSAPSGLDQFNVGASQTGANPWGGAVAEFAIFDRVLTAEEVAAMFVLGAPLTDMGAITTPGIYLLDGQFRLASGSSGARVEIDAGGMAGYDESGTLQVAWYSSGDDAGKVIAGGGNIFFDESGQTLIAPASLVRTSYIQWDTVGGVFRSRVGADSGGTLYVQAGSAIDIGLYDGASTETQLIYVSASFVAIGTDLRVDVGGLAVGSPSIDPSPGAIHFVERAADPTEPAEGQAVLWMSDGTGKGDDGDVLIASQAGGVTRYATVFDHSGGSAW